MKPLRPVQTVFQFGAGRRVSFRYNGSVKKHDDTSMSRLLRQLPSVARLLEAVSVKSLSGIVPVATVTAAARTTLEQARSALLSDGDDGVPTLEELAARTVIEARRRDTRSLQEAINATGVVLHTGLGRARLALAAQEALNEVARGHALVEIDRETGQRGSRRDHVRGLLCELTGAEDAAVVNNCAAAVLLCVTVLAAGREVIISRGELVEIGGAFRMPDIVRASGATLVEVGTTNRTRIADYEAAITERTGLILRCHPSNFRIVGFTEEAPTEALARLGRVHKIPVLDDQGSGALLSVAGVKSTLLDSVRAGSDLIAASGDKLLGGPQAGLILGKRELVARVTKHPLARTLRVDKLTLAALEATLRLYRDPELALQTIPTLRYLSRTEPELRRMATRLQTRLRAVLPEEQFALRLVRENSQVGGGSLPGELLPTICVALQSRTGKPSPDAIVALLRRQTPPVFARIKEDAVLFDPRTVEPDEFGAIAAAAGALIEQ